MNWEKLFKRYIWDDERTPYLVSVAKMTRKQADYELYAYTLFLGILFSILCLIGMSHGSQSEWLTLYGFTIIASAIIFGMIKHIYAAYYCVGAPIAAMMYFLLQGFPARLAPIDHFVLIVFCLIWLRYSFRVVNIAKAYPDMPESHGEQR